MADKTKISWTDATWNPITGCSVVSAGCKHCYAMKLAGTRLQHHPSRAGLTIDTPAGPVWNGQVRFNEYWLDQPLRWSRPRRIFVCAHGDLFHEAVPFDWICRVFEIMARAPQHTFQVLTKRPERMLSFLMHAALVGASDGLYAAAKGRWPLPNVWLGVSVEDQAAADERVSWLLRCPAAVRWISAEPLLGPVDLESVAWPEKGDHRVDVLRGGYWNARGVRANGPAAALGAPRGGFTSHSDMKRIDWVVAGGESGPGARPVSPDWLRALRDQCAAAGVPYQLKQWGEWIPMLGQAEGLKVRKTTTTPDGWVMGLAGKPATGRHLDGVLHDALPEIAR